MMWFFGDRALRPRPVWRRGVQRDGVDGVCGVIVRYGGIGAGYVVEVYGGWHMSGGVCGGGGSVYKSILGGRMVAIMTCQCGTVTRESENRNTAILSCKNCVNAIVIRPSPMLPAQLCWLEAVGPQPDARPQALFFKTGQQ